MLRIHNIPIKEFMFGVHEGAWQLAFLTAVKNFKIYLTSLTTRELSPPSLGPTDKFLSNHIFGWPAYEKIEKPYAHSRVSRSVF